MRGTTRPRRLKAKGQLFVVVDAGDRMQRKAAGGETQGGPAHRLGNIAQQTPHMLAGAFAGGQLPLHRSS